MWLYHWDHVVGKGCEESCPGLKESFKMLLETKKQNKKLLETGGKRSLLLVAASLATLSPAVT